MAQDMTFEECIDFLSELVHMTNKIYCESLGDFSQKDWADTPEDIKNSARHGVRDVIFNSSSPEQTHETWYSFKKSQGWKYGPIKDPKKKEHPCLVPYKDLPVEQKFKDLFFVSIVNFFKPIVKDYFESTRN